MNKNKIQTDNKPRDDFKSPTLKTSLFDLWMSKAQTRSGTKADEENFRVVRLFAEGLIYRLDTEKKDFDNFLTNMKKKRPVAGQTIGERVTRFDTNPLRDEICRVNDFQSLEISARYLPADENAVFIKRCNERFTEVK